MHASQRTVSLETVRSIAAAVACDADRIVTCNMRDGARRFAGTIRPYLPKNDERKYLG